MSNTFIYIITIFAVFLFSIEGRDYVNIIDEIHQKDQPPDMKKFSTLRCGKCVGGICERYSYGEYCKCPPGKAWYYITYRNISECRDCNCGENQLKCIFDGIFDERTMRSCTCKAGFGDKNGTCVDCDCGYGFSCRFQRYGNPEKTCLCGKGYTELNGKCERDKICTDQLCKNGGRCWDNMNHTDYKCTCPSNRTGKNCERDINGCDSNPCQNGGVCWSGKGTRYLCICPETHAGRNCERKIHVCDKKPCSNGGRCWRGKGSEYYCSCPEKFTGKFCETVIDPCDSKPCKNGGTCWRGEDRDYLCTCLAGYGERNCDTGKPISTLKI